MNLVRFGDGPAGNHALQLARAPIFLRVVLNPAGEIDALDQLDDVPATDEAIHVYRRVGGAGSVHIDSRDSRTGRRIGRTYASAEYRLHGNQPADAVLRQTKEWRSWCAEEVRRATAEGEDDR